MKEGMEIRNKRGQFYLIAAMIISIILIALVTLSNYSKKQESATLYNLGEELKAESSYVFDYGLSRGYNDAQMKNLSSVFLKDYINYAKEGKNLYFIFGDANAITITGYSQENNVIYVNPGSGENPMTINSRNITSSDFIPSAQNITLKINETKYEFNLKPGKNFYFVALQSIGEENYVVKN